MSESEQSVATLVFPEDYMHQLNSVASVTTQNVVLLKRKFMSKAGWELVPMPLSEFTAIEYREELAFTRILFGGFLVILVLFVLAMLVKYWNDLEPSTRVPVGALAIAAVYGARLAFGARRHRFIFLRADGSKVGWKSRSGDHKLMKPLVEKLAEFARSRGLMRCA
jgi:hypothetical protein